ncbi:MAG TPA: CorA family divalent cation transporter [Rudaea sp.]
MLTIYATDKPPVVWKPGVAMAPDTVWLDLRDPTDAEREFAQKHLESKLPTREQISGIELSSRIRADSGTLCLNIPTFVRDDGGQGNFTPLGFVLTPNVLVSQRYADAKTFEVLAARYASKPGPASSAEAIVAIIDTFVDVAADRMERDSAELSKLSRAVFSERPDHARLQRSALFQLGRMQRSITQTRAAVLGLSRIVEFMHDTKTPCLGEEDHKHLSTLHKDLKSLSDFDQQFSDKVQFLLDAVLGFINTEQNDVMKVLTIASVATIPPVILAGIWGMNFKSIPEYDWPHGYAFALTMIGLSIVVPLLFFKWKKWF